MQYVKCLRTLVYLAVANIVNAFLNYLPLMPASISTWISRGIMAASVICLYSMSCANSRYKMAAVFRGITLGCALFTSFLLGSMLLSVAASVCSVLAVYQEYSAHAAVTVEKNEELSRRWRSLFYWEFLASVLLTVGSSITAVIVMSADVHVDASAVSAAVIFLLNIPRLAIQLIRILYLYRTIRLLLPMEA